MDLQQLRSWINRECYWVEPEQLLLATATVMVVHTGTGVSITENVPEIGWLSRAGADARHCAITSGEQLRVASSLPLSFPPPSQRRVGEPRSFSRMQIAPDRPSHPT
jgi:hypothetical protein